jgi:hypothetical protein
LFTLVLVALVLLWVVARYIQTEQQSPEVKRFVARSIWCVILFFLAFGAYWVGSGWLSEHLPPRATLNDVRISSGLVLLSLVFAISFAALTAAFTLPALRIYILKYRTVPRARPAATV